MFLDESTWGATMTATDASVTLYGENASGYLGTAGVGGRDIDGDGIEDLVIGASSNDNNISGGGAVFIVPGW